MKKQRLSIRLLSLLLTLCLLIGILPAGMAVQADPDAYHFFFMRLRHGSYSTAAYQPQDVTEWGWEVNAPNYKQYETDPFIYYGEGGNLTDFSWQSSSANEPEFGPYLIGKPGAWGGYVIRIDSSGYFTPTITYAGVTNGGKFNAYIAPLGVENPRDEKYLVGQFNTKTAAIAYQKKAVMNKVALAAGDYIFCYEVAEGQDEPTSWVSALNLDPTSGKWIDLNADAVELEMFQNDSTDVSVMLSGNYIDASDLDSLEIAVNDPSIASAELVVDANGAHIEIEGKYLGTTAVNVTAKEGDAIGQINIPVNVLWATGYKQTDVALVDMPDSVELGYTKEASATLKFNGLPFSFEDADSIEFYAEDENVVVPSYDFDEDGNIVLSLFAKTVGETDVTLKVVVDDTPATATAHVGVHARVFNFNFMKLYYGPWSTSAFHPTTIDNFDKMDSGNKGDINPNGPYSDPWMYSKTTGDGAVDWTPSCITYGMDIRGSKGSAIQFKIRMEGSGVFQAILNATKAATGQNAEVFVAPLDAPNPTAPWYSVGVVDTWANTYDYFVDIPLENTVLAAGDYYLTFVMTDPNPRSSATWMPTAAFKLKTLQILKVTLEHDADETTVMKNGSETINLSAKYDGESYDFSNIETLTVASDHPEIATGSVDVENATMTINGHALGNAVLTVTGHTYDGEEIIFNVPYQVVPAEFFRRVTTSADPSELGVGETTEIDWHAYSIDKQEIDKSILQVYHESSDTAVAMVDDKGVVTARNGGKATITTYVLHQDGSTRSSTTDITVGGFQELGKVELIVPAMVQAGGNVTLATKARFADNTSADLEALGAKITYEVLEGSARISKNLMRASARGTIVLRSVVEFNGTTYYSDPVTVQAVKNGDPAAFAKLVLSADRVKLSVGESASLKAGGQLIDGSYVYYTELFTHASNKHNTITLENSNEDVISIEDGVIRALKVGASELTLTAEVEGVPHEETLTIVVDDGVLESATVSLAKATVFVGDKADINVRAQLSNGRFVKESDLTLDFATDNDAVAVVENGSLVAKGLGTAKLTATATLNGVSVDGTVTVTVEDDTLNTLTATASALTIKPSSEGTQISVTAKTKSGATLDPANLTLTYKSLDESLATVSESGFVTPHAKGNATIEVTADQNGVKRTATVTIKIKDGKEAPTYITYEKREAAKENIKNFDWAKRTRDNYMNAYAYYLDDPEWAWNLITSQDIPRACDVGSRWHPDKYNCHYCGVNVTSATGDFYPWKYDVKNYPWKIQCPNCMRRFPSNDFEAFYNAGINDHGFFDYEYAKQNASHLLVNSSYPEKDEHIDKNGVLQNEGIHNWGVDDSRGYVTDEDYELLLGYGTAKHTKTYIAYYNHWALWYGPNIDYAVQYMASAYAMTGDMRYGRIGAIMIDRIADMYPDMYVSEYFPLFSNSDFNSARGRAVGGIWETGVSAALCKTYDMLYPAFDDPWVVNFLHNKAVKYNLGDPRGEHGTEFELRGGVGNDKSTPELIRQNIENGLLREVIDGVLVENQIYGNQGMHQGSATAAAVVLDSMPETSDTLDWVLGTGGKVLSDIIGTINRDGQGVEAAPGYSDTWVSSYSGIVDVLESYDGYAAANLYDNPKYVKLMKTNFPMTLTRNGTAPIGDSGSVAGLGMSMSMGRLVTAFIRTGDPEIAQMIYFLNGNKAEGIEADIYTPATTVAKDIQAVIDTYGEYPFDESSAMTGSFGFYALRDGVYKKGLSRPVNTQRDFWMFFGRSTNHGHPGVMHLGIDAYGMAIASDFGYPESTSGTPRTLHWDRSTIIHNTVQVNDKEQIDITGGQALHFEGDNDGRVQVMDAKAPNVYQETDEYRRTTVMVDYDEEISYAVDFFRVLGGDSHTFAFHVIGEEAPTSPNLKLVKQSMGTYAGPLVPYGPMDHPNYAETSGYDGFYDVSRAASPGNEFTVDFKVDDHRDRLTENRDVHLKMTQLNDFDITEVALAKANPPKNSDNPDYVNSILVDRHGKNLDSLFTTVFQPYDGDPYIEKEEQVSIVRSGGATPGAKDTAKAVKVTMKNGRVDYIIYATNNNVQYQIDGRIQFKGFVGVVSMEDEKIVYSYVCDGSLIGDTTATPSYTGTVSDFTRELSFDNEIIVTPNAEMDLEDIIGRYIFVNGKAHSYKIQRATKRADGKVVLGIGDFCLASSVKDANNPLTGGYNYEIAAGQSFEIPLSVAEDDSPIFTAIPNQVVTVGDTLTVPFNAETKSGAVPTFELVEAPNNTVLNADEMTVSFGPVTSQIGSHTIGIKASNGSLGNVIYFEVDVFAGSSNSAGGGGGDSSDDEEEVTYEDLGNNIYKDSDGNILSAGPDKTPGTADDITDVKKVDDEYVYTKDGKTYTAGADGLLGTADDEVEEDVVTPTEKFVDLGNHAWAKDAIYRLVDAGVIKGVAEDKFAPAAQITRADFAILLVRAWDLTAENKGTYDDVAETDYFANEVGIASALGIVKGVGEGKFAPKAPITREQMMVMLSRTLEAVKAEVKEVEDDVLESFTDADLISDYAVESVKSMVGNGFIQGSDGKINPQGNATRAEVAVLLDRILNK